MVAIGSDSGLHLSTDSGDTFRTLLEGRQTLAVFFDLDGMHLWVSTPAGTPALARMDWRTGGIDEVALPPLTRDAVAYVTQNPASRREYAIATFQRSAFISPDGGKTWRQIARNGRDSSP